MYFMDMYVHCFYDTVLSGCNPTQERLSPRHAGRLYTYGAAWQSEAGHGASGLCSGRSRGRGARRAWYSEYLYIYIVPDDLLRILYMGRERGKGISEYWAFRSFKPSSSFCLAGLSPHHMVRLYSRFRSQMVVLVTFLQATRSLAHLILLSPGTRRCTLAS